jgi:signal transduction histidine kinase
MDERGPAPQVPRWTLPGSPGGDDQRVSETDHPAEEASRLAIEERRPLLESEAHLRPVLDQLPALVWTTDRELRFTCAIGRELAELAEPPLRGVSLQDFLKLPDPNDPILVQYRRALEGTPVTVDSEWMGRGYQTHVEPFRDGEGRIVGVLAVTWNVTERRRAEDRLRLLAEAGAIAAESLDYERTLRKVARLAVGSLADWCMVSVLEDGCVRPVATAHVDGAKEALFQGLPSVSFDALGDLGPLLQGGRSVLLPQVTPEMMGPGRGFPLPEGEVGLRVAEIIERVGVRSLMVTPLVARKQTLGVLAFARANAGRRFDAADLSVAEELARRCAVAIDNALLYRTAQEAIGARDEFLSVASHELRTPLTSIQLRLESLERSLRNGKPVILTGPEGALSVVLRQFKRLANLVEQLLDVSRVRRGALDLVLEEVDLTQVVREVGARLEGDFARGGGSLAIDAPAGAVGRWDRVRVEQIVTDLLSNALKFARGTVVEVEVGAGSAMARLVVRDRGMGISDIDQARIFERFERAASTRHFGGLGLGLYITRQIVVAHGGTIRLTSAPGQGTTVVVELPRVRPERVNTPGPAYP